jgi:excisionase family DNA binding protein
MSPAYTIPRLIEHYKGLFPDSQLSERAIRQAVKNGNLRAVFVGTRALITTENFERWLRHD